MSEPSGRDVAAIIREGTTIDRAIEAARRRTVGATNNSAFRL